MTKNEFIGDLAEMLETKADAIQIGSALTDLENWDSLAVLNFIALADAKYSLSISPPQLQQCTTVADLFNLVEKAKQG